MDSICYSLVTDWLSLQYLFPVLVLIGLLIVVIKYKLWRKKCIIPPPRKNGKD